ncbi:MAG: tryptophan synthase subunit alpha [Cellulosilyticaceae bacterium]
MSRIAERFKVLQEEGKCGFIPFVTAGDPHLQATKTFIKILDDSGSAVIEIGVPFSDPVADGETIQRSYLRAMAEGVNLGKIFEMVAEVRSETKAALVFLIYANMIEHYGREAFFRRCKEVGMDGVIIPDVPVEEMEDFECVAKDYKVDMIRLIAPTSKERIATIAKEATGFIYCVSSLGVTGVREAITTPIEEMIAEVRKVTQVPVAIGFGIATPEQAQGLRRYGDGIIVGSAIVKQIEEYKEQAGEYLSIFAEEMIEVLSK